jgi:hypothetical protein
MNFVVTANHVVARMPDLQTSGDSSYVHLVSSTMRLIIFTTKFQATIPVFFENTALPRPALFFTKNQDAAINSALERAVLPFVPASERIATLRAGKFSVRHAAATRMLLSSIRLLRGIRAGSALDCPSSRAGSCPL